MATSVESPPPSRARTLVLDESRLHAQVIEHLTRAADAARKGAANPDLTTGVHEVRKAARRVRAIAELAREGLARGDLRSACDALRHARHVLGPARDHAVAAHIVPQLVLDAPAREAAKLVLDAAAVDLPSSEATREALSESAETVIAQVEALKAALPDSLTFEMLVDGVKTVYGRARRAREAAKRSRRAFHAWRRRSKELGYQLDVLGDAAGPRISALRGGLRDVARAQRDVVDLLMIRDFVRSHRDLVARDTVALLLDTLDAQLRPLLKDVRRAGKAAFREKPRRLARSACRDVTVA
jgi:hypothetical protein